MDTRLADDIIAHRELIDYLLSRLNTCCPGEVVSFDDATTTVTVCPAVQMKVVVGETTTYVDMPEIMCCPCVLPMAAVRGFALTLPISAGDPCIIHFSQRCIDNWLQHGGVQPPETTNGSVRHHDINDAIVSFAATPLTQVFADWLTNGIELRNRSRSVRLSLTDEGIEINGAVSFLSPVTFHDTVDAKQSVTFEAQAVFQAEITDMNGIDHTTHKHVDPQGGSVGVPTL
jgi:hypothetical protein